MPEKCTRLINLCATVNHESLRTSSDFRLSSIKETKTIFYIATKLFTPTYSMQLLLLIRF